MSSPTTNKGYTYPAHGGGVGTWDSNLNGNFEYQDLNLGGYYSITASSSITVANTFNSTFATIASTAQSITLPTSIAQNLFYNVLGTLQSSLTINMPAAGSIYTFGNNLTTGSSYAVAAQPTGGSAVTLTSGGQEIVVMNSSAAYPAQNAFGAITTASITNSSGLTSGGPITQNSSQYEQLANGPTAARPAATAAYFRYNTTLLQPEWSDGVSWYPVGAQPVAAGFKNPKITNNAGTPNTQIDVTADAVTAETTSGTSYRLSTVAFTIDCTVTGANGLDAGGLAASTWYSVWVIYNPATATVAGLASLSATAPTMPAGYTAKCRIGWRRTTAASVFHRILQYGRRAQYVVSASITTALPNIANGTAGTYSFTAPVYAAVSISNFVPTTATVIAVTLGLLWNNNTASSVFVAPNTSYSGTKTTNPPIAALESPTQNNVIIAWMVLEATTIAWCSAAAGGFISCLGWEDNL